MESQHTFKTEALPTEQTTDSNTFKPDTTELPSHFQSYLDRACTARRIRTSMTDTLKSILAQTDKMALRVAARFDRMNNHLDFMANAQDSPLEDPIAREKLSGAL